MREYSSTLEDSQGFYDARYGNDWKNCGDTRFTKMWYKAFVRHVLPNLRAGCALEIGSGYGYLATYLLQRGIEYTATDIAQKALEQVPVGPRCHAVRASGERLPFSAHTFDLVICMEVLEHVLSPKAVIAECFRVSRRGAKLVFSSPSYLNLHSIFKVAADLHVPWFRKYTVAQPIDRWMMPWTLPRWLRSYGTIDSSRAVRLHPPLFERLDAISTLPNDLVFSLEDQWGDRVPWRWLGLHRLIVVTAPS